MILTEWIQFFQYAYSAYIDPFMILCQWSNTPVCGCYHSLQYLMIQKMLFYDMINCISMDVCISIHNFLHRASVQWVKLWACTWPLRHRKSQGSIDWISRAQIHLRAAWSQIRIIPFKSCVRYPNWLFRASNVMLWYAVSKATLRSVAIMAVIRCFTIGENIILKLY